jgi:hypothetical protein
MTIDQEQYHKPPLSGVTQRVQAASLIQGRYGSIDAAL